MSVLYSLIDTLLPFEWTEFAYMKNAFLAVLLITPLFGLVGTMEMCIRDRTCDPSHVKRML